MGGVGGSRKSATLPITAAVVAVMLSLAQLATMVGAGMAEAAQGSEVKEALRIDLFGDSLAQGLWVGLAHKYRAEKSVTIADRSQIGTGITRDDVYDWPKEIGGLLKASPVKIAVVMIGGNDGQPIRVAGKEYREKVGTELWKQTYGDRVEQVIAALQSSGAAVYWVSLPIQRDAARDETGRMINDIVRDRAGKRGATFVDIYPLFADAQGHYSAYLPDKSGRSRLMRASDGLHFTADGWFAVSDYLIEQMAKNQAIAAMIEAVTPKSSN